MRDGSISCDTCGRTILQGERTWEYLTPDGEPRRICELCRTGAEAAGWRRADVTLDERDAGSRPKRRRSSLLARTRRLLEREGQGADPDAEATNETKAQTGSAGGTQGVPAGPEGRSRRGVGGVRTLPADPAARFAAAMERFNRSDHTRTVAGLAKTLGQPHVSAGAAAGSPGEIRLTVAWDLSWYQWSVDLSDDSAPVRALAKGAELGELDEPARQWNAGADAEGHLHPGRASGGKSG